MTGAAGFTRLRHRNRTWSRTVTTKVRYFARHKDALKAAERLRAHGHLVELSTTGTITWTVDDGQDSMEVPPWSP